MTEPDPLPPLPAGIALPVVAPGAPAADKEICDLFPLVYEELRRRARAQLQSERDGHTLNTTGLVHEVYLNLAADAGRWQDRAHFLAVASRAMRHVLVDYARQRGAQKRGCDPLRVPLEEHSALADEKATDLLLLDQALSALSVRSLRLSKVAECRIFGGMTTQETAEALSVSGRTVEREWTRARTYLYELMQS